MVVSEFWVWFSADEVLLRRNLTIWFDQQCWEHLFVFIYLEVFLSVQVTINLFLQDKWNLGTGLPSKSVSFQGSRNYTAAYTFYGDNSALQLRFFYWFMKSFIYIRNIYIFVYLFYLFIYFWCNAVYLYLFIYLFINYLFID